MTYSIKNVHKFVVHVKIMKKENTTIFIITTIWSPWSHDVPHKKWLFWSKTWKN